MEKIDQNAMHFPTVQPSFDLESGLDVQGIPEPHPPPPPPPPSPPPPMTPGTVAPQSSNDNALTHNDIGLPEWLSLILNFNSVATNISLQSIQAPTSKQPPIGLHMAGLGLVLALASIVVSKYIPATELGTRAKQLLVNAGVLFGLTSFILAVTISFPFYLKLVSWTIYVVVLLAVVYFCCLRSFTPACGTSIEKDLERKD